MWTHEPLLQLLLCKAEGFILQLKAAQALSVCQILIVVSVHTQFSAFVWELKAANVIYLKPGCSH